MNRLKVGHIVESLYGSHSTDIIYKDIITSERGDLWLTPYDDEDGDSEPIKTTDISIQTFDLPCFVRIIGEKLQGAEVIYKEPIYLKYEKPIFKGRVVRD